MQYILTETQDSIAIITISRPEQLNALNKQTISELSSVLDEFSNNNKIKVLIITGAGEKAFVAGADIKEFINFSAKEGSELSEKGHELLFNKIANYNKPIIAAINGFALGGGLELALACHIRVAADKAKLGLPEVTLGLIPGYGGTQRLTQIIGKGKALELMLSANMLSAHDALEWRLVNHVFPLSELIENTLKLAHKISLNSPNAIKQVLNSVKMNEIEIAALKNEIKLFGECFGTADFIEGTKAFIEKRKPNF